MVNRVQAVLIFATADEDEVLDEVHALELLEDKLLFARVKLLVF